MRVNEIFSSINGEVSSQHQGSLCTFIRLSGCDFAKHPCKWCDTPYALSSKSGKNMTVGKIIAEVEKIGNKNIVITGGEPLRQDVGVYNLCHTLGGRYDISIETNGSFPIPFPFALYVRWVMDYKTLSSGNHTFMKYENFRNLTEKDFIKFVISDKKDFLFAMGVYKVLLSKYFLQAKVAFSPCQPGLSPETLEQWMQKDPLLKSKGAVLSLQLHKIIGVK